MTGTELSYIALASRDVPAVCEFLGDDLALPRHDITSPTGAQQAAFAVGRTALVVFEAGDPFLCSPQTGIDHIALVGGFADQATTLEHTPGLKQTRQQIIANSLTCGVNVRLTQSIGLVAEAGDYIERVDHIGIASSDNVEAERVFLGSYGCTYESRQTDMEVSQAIESFTSDKYGVIYHTRRPQPIGGLRVSFLTVGDCELEFLQNFDPAQGFADRAVMYALAAWTGFRKSEIGSLTLASLDLNGSPPTATVQSAFSKRRRLDRQVLHPQLAEQLRKWLADKQVELGVPLFPISDKTPGVTNRPTHKMISRDMEAARRAWTDEAESESDRVRREKSDFLAYCNHAGLYADFHSCRHLFITNLERAGVRPKSRPDPGPPQRHSADAERLHARRAGRSDGGDWGVAGSAGVR